MERQTSLAKDARARFLAYTYFVKRTNRGLPGQSLRKPGASATTDFDTVSEGSMSVELVAMQYTIRLYLDCGTSCRGSMIRLPDGVEASFDCLDSMLVLLEGMGGRRWWQDNQAQIAERFSPFLKERAAMC